MKIRYPLVLFITSIVAGAAVAAPKPAAPSLPSGPGVNPCPTPSATDCLKPGYLDGKCGIEHKAVCKPVIEKAFTDDPGRASAPQVKMLKPQGSDIPADLKEGAHRKSYGGPSSRSKISLAGKNLLERTGVTRSPLKALRRDPSKAHRKPAWDTNGEKIKSCEEFAYEQVYDWARYTDAAAACGSDRLCQVDMAFLPATPGIANRVLVRKDGKPLSKQFEVLNTGSLPKNDMFAMGSRFAYAGGKDGVRKSPEIDALIAELDAGKKFYGFGCNPKAKIGATPGETSGGTPCSDRRFQNEWAFHKALRERNATLSPSEFAEYEERKAKFRELISQWHGAVWAEKKAIEDKLPRSERQWVAPIDLVSRDPIERLGVMNEILIAGDRNAKLLIKQLGGVKMNGMPGAGIKAGPVAAQAPAVQGSLAPTYDRSGGVATGVLALPKKPGAPSSGPKPNAQTAAEAAASLCMPKNFGNAYETVGYGPISCRIGQFLRAEYARKARGQKSCLDLGEDDCDWSPQLFNERFVAGVPYIAKQQFYETDCINYTGGSINKPNLTAAEDYIKAMKVAIGTAKVALSPYAMSKQPGDKGQRYGESIDDAASTGDKDWFAAGYDYTLGWGAVPVKLDSTKYDGICELAGDAKGGFGVDAWLIGSKFEVVDGLAKGDINKGGNHFTTAHAHLRVFSVDVFKPFDAKFQGTYAPNPWLEIVQIPTGYRPSFTFMAGPIPITGAVWGEFFYGAAFRVEGVSHAVDCDAANVKFGLQGTFEPTLGLNGKAQVGIGISGVASAGIRGMLNLVTIGVPVNVGLMARVITIAEQAQAALEFTAQIDLRLSTLSGYIAVYIEILFVEEEWEIFAWNGVSKTIPLMEPLSTKLALVGMK